MISTVADGRRWMVAAAIGTVVVALDQLTKSWAVSALSDGRVIDVAWTLRFRLAFNTGMSFSLGSGYGWVIAPAALAVVAGLLWMARRMQNPLGLFAIGLVVGGAAGNLVDRVFRAGDGFLGGAVVDFIDVQWWPVFNIADMGIVIGAILLLFVTWLEPPDPAEADRVESEVPDDHDSRDHS